MGSAPSVVRGYVKAYFGLLLEAVQPRNVTLSRNVAIDPKCHTSLSKCRRYSLPKCRPILTFFMQNVTIFYLVNKT